LGIGHGKSTELNPPVVDGSVFFNLSPPPRIDFNTFGTFSQTGPGGFVQFTGSGMPGPFLEAEAKISQNFFGRASVILRYQMEILGPAESVPVSVQVSGGAAGSSVVGDPFAGFALKSFWSLSDVTLGLSPVFSEGIDTPQLSGIFNESFGHTVDLTLIANHVYLVEMVADASVAAGSSGTLGFATAFIDPLFSFGPDVGPEYSFHFSEGIGNSAVPEQGSPLVPGMAIVVLGLFHCVVSKNSVAGKWSHLGPS
jgi:hypothetical protein